MHRIKSHLYLLSLLLMSSNLLANQSVSSSFLCSHFDRSTYECINDKISAGSDLVVVKGMKLSFFTAISSSEKRGISHVWVNEGVEDSIKHKFRDIAPIVTVNKQKSTDEDTLKYKVHYTSNSPTAWILRFAGESSTNEKLVKAGKDIANTVITSAVTQPFINQLSALYADEKLEKIATISPTKKNEYLHQIKIYISYLNVNKSKNYRTFSNKIIDPLAHKGAWIIYVLDDQGEVLNSFKFKIS